MEILTGKRPTDPMFCNGHTIVDFVKKSYQHEALHILDACLQEECHHFARSNMDQEDNSVYQCVDTNHDQHANALERAASRGAHCSAAAQTGQTGVKEQSDRSLLAG